MTRATLRPHLAGAVGLTRLSCQMPPDASLLVLPVEIMKALVEEYVVPLRSWSPVWKTYGSEAAVVPVPSVRLLNQPAGAAVCLIQNRRSRLAPTGGPAWVFATVQEQSPSASEVQVTGLPVPVDGVVDAAVS